MSIFVQATPAPKPKTKDVRTIATFYAGILLLMAVAQLFTFDEFTKLVASFMLPSGERAARLLAAILVTAEVFALPFLLRMRLSPAFRWLSMVLGWVVALIWAYISIWLVSQDTLINNIGFLGTAIGAMPGWWAIFLSIAFGILAAWSAWGMWPAAPSAKRVKKLRK